MASVDGSGEWLAGQEGLEPPTLGFGDRCSTVGATGLPAGLAAPAAYFFFSLCGVCLRSKGQYFLSSSFHCALGALRSVYVRRPHSEHSRKMMLALPLAMVTR